MKKIIASLLVFSSLFLFSCDDVEEVRYSPENGTFLSFSASLYNLPVPRDSQVDINLPFQSSSASSVDRVYNVEIIAEETTADPATYQLPATLTIPANSYIGNLTIRGIDVNVTSEAKQLVFKITGFSAAESFDNDTITVSIFEVCPLNADFTGTYVITQLSTGPVAGPLFGNGTVVTVTANGEYGRSFSAAIYPTAGSFGSETYSFNLTCGNSVFSGTVDTGIACTPPAGQPRNSVKLAPADNPGTYTPGNDQQFTLRIKENTTNSCGAPTAETVLRFTKQ